MDSQFRLQIELDNDAFTDNPLQEIARILQATASKLLQANSPDEFSYYQNLKDINGNSVGTYGIKTNEYLSR